MSTPFSRQSYLYESESVVYPEGAFHAYTGQNEVAGSARGKVQIARLIQEDVYALTQRLGDVAPAGRAG